MSAAISIQRASRLANIPSDRLLRKWVNAALAGIKAANASEVTLRIVNAAEGRNLNSAFRGKDYPTNILTFVYHEKKSPVLLGDLVICAQVVAHEAKDQHKTLADHYAHLCVHGILHLGGFDHESPRDAKRMEALEVKMLAGLGVGNPYRDDDQYPD
ncbi:MAG: rRNA maturation RNase YbeY [Rhodocyclaceae bacterium]|jgi:probable rRNA maturation factor|nr:rRNA maturation RNase YbeY [Rhodocyclaceae bacterium]MCA3033176.1 rRNA maturation RNase YbeY [Rhodocyclaceae bacterium]MCA3045488.1 rRNA maturation RNase YbeY [Rhodocyclaceae bacterium]MCA3051179.1 rRNA maturation RNase YbeY [Rhodocyclaceae bacterium]MCA3057104.1 rRNA maturation RNase YbeY [Rhodocyclaceae bacterium]